MDKKNELNVDQLDAVVGGTGRDPRDSKFSIICKFCGAEIKASANFKKKTGAALICSCGAKYNPSLANPWIEPK